MVQQSSSHHRSQLEGSGKEERPLHTVSHIRKSHRLNVDMDMNVKSLSRVRLFATPWTVAYQVPQSMGFSRQ